MSKQLISVPTMHQDHRDWQSIHSMWKLDLESWSKQLETGLSQSAEMQQMLTHLHEMLVEHNRTLDEQDKNLRQHEHDLASCERLGLGYLETLTLKHVDLTQRVQRARRNHEHIKTQHHKLLANLAAMQKTIEQST